MRNFLVCLGWLMATACSISYKFNGASIDYTKVKTIMISDFTNQASYVNPTWLQSSLKS